VQYTFEIWEHQLGLGLLTKDTTAQRAQPFEGEERDDEEEGDEEEEEEERRKPGVWYLSRGGGIGAIAHRSQSEFTKYQVSPRADARAHCQSAAYEYIPQLYHRQGCPR